MGQNVVLSDGIALMRTVCLNGSNRCFAHGAGGGWNGAGAESESFLNKKSFHRMLN
jgi:hypothetical protein